ncbi:2-hydroxyacid dehydrogenase [Undibacterium griseum]|uniref:Glyoxylate/hydroxypyruvate reductase A n=1 Tax=Undibacterium griseum TaxID=2762295 RepID=A0ABR6YM61_9BURK|nr:glyoxylate/hydroxypyruvate reductase A [Undibacterium griseum]MBC3884985.1 glyoxylate/hydroxypyruvate reductase A [Undibacterium griseum]
MNNPVIPFIVAPDYAHTDAWRSALQAEMPEFRITSVDALTPEEKQTVTVAIVANPDPAVLQQLPKLVWVHSVWAGVERLLTDLGHTELKIVRLIDPQLADTMAEAVLAWTLYLHRDMPRYARQQKARQWLPHAYIPPQRKTVSLLGLGALGKAAATRLQLAGFQVCAWSRHPKALDAITCFHGEEGLIRMLNRTDILICLLPLTAETRHLLNRKTLQQLPQGASLINFGRGLIVHDENLRTMLDSNHIQHAVLDVFEHEPLPADSWHWHHPGVTVLPHCSAPTDRQTASAIVAARLRSYMQSGAIPESVNVAQGY